MSMLLDGTQGIDFNDGSNQSTAATPYARKNLIINGAMTINQRGNKTGITGLDYQMDRFQLGPSSLGTWSSEQSTDVPTGQGFASSMKISCTTADAAPAASDLFYLFQRIEGQNLQHIKKGTSNAESLTLSFWVKCNKTGNFQVNLRDADNTRQIGESVSISAADTWEKKTITFAGDTTGTLDNDNAWSLSVEWFFDAGTDYTSGTTPTSWESAVNTDRAAATNLALGDNTSNYINITGVQLEVGDSASDFEFMPYDMELARCQRYYQSMSSFSVAGYSSGVSESIFGTYQFKVTMRAAPTVTITNTGSTSRLTSFSAHSTTADSVSLQVVANGAGFAGVYGGTVGNATIEL